MENRGDARAARDVNRNSSNKKLREATVAEESIWACYKSFAKRNYRTLQQWDDTATSLLYWTPFSNSSGRFPTSRWREILYGFLSLHRMTVEIAVGDQALQNPYGTTVKVGNGECTHATAIRLALTILQCLLPAMMELSSPGEDSVISGDGASFLRLYVERTKFLLRTALLFSYWRTIGWCHLRHAGILRRGGLYVPGDDLISNSIEDEACRERRQKYSGRRTGRRVCSRTKDLPCRSATTQRMLLMVGEALNVCRPLYWANVEARNARSVNGRSRPKLQSWLVALCFELASVRCLAMSGADGSSCDEMKRRRMRIMLCLLRAPVWETVSHPCVRKLLAVILRIPLGGRLIETYLLEVLSYWKHPYFLEQS